MGSYGVIVCIGWLGRASLIRWHLSKNLKEVGEGERCGSLEKNVPGRGNNKCKDLKAESSEKGGEEQ